MIYLDMKSDYSIDFHKLNYHPKRVSEWLDGKNIDPIYIEVSPSGGCNHRCMFCALDFMGYQKRFIDSEIFKSRLSEMGQCGIKSIQYAGEGEPLLHRGIVGIVNHTKAMDIDVGISTNGVLLSPILSDELLHECTWIKVSIAAGTPETYSKIHRCRSEDFGTVIDNLAYAAKIKGDCALGMQVILLPENQYELEVLAKIARDIGMDYLVVKPYSHHPLSKTERYKDIIYKSWLYYKKKLEKLNTRDFSVIFRKNGMEKWDDKDIPYDICHALHFWVYVDAGADVWGCSVYLGDKRFYYGNLYQDTVKEIFDNRKVGKFDISECRVGCRMDECNRYLWRLKHPEGHDNFI